MNTLLFVYNASSAFWSKKIDFAHKIISPATYSCSLCALTHGKFTVQKEWRDFKESSPISMEFQYKNDFVANYPDYDGELPVVFLKKSNGELVILLESSILKQLDTVNDLIQELQLRLKTLV